MPDDITPLTPEWWLRRLYKQVTARQAGLTLLDDYYRGAHPLPILHDRARTEFVRMLTLSRANYMQLVVDAAVERMHVDGFRVAGQVNNEAWRVWQSNNLDSASEMVFLESLVGGTAYMLVDPADNGRGAPTVTVEHASQTIIAYQPGSRRRRLAGLKVWDDDIADLLVACLYLPGEVVTFAAPRPRVKVTASTETVTGYRNVPATSALQAPTWERQDSMSGPNSLGMVPLVEFPNRPRMLDPGTSEMQSVIDIQDRINKTLADRMMAQEYGAFKQKWVTGFDIPTDDKGNPIEPFRVAVDRMFMSESPDTTFGQFDSTDLKPYLDAIGEDVKAIAAIVSTPPHYLLGEMVNLSAEALKASEAALVSRVRRHMGHFEESLEDVVRLFLQADGSPLAADDAMETVWRNPEFRTESALVDALVKMSTLGVPKEALWERWGATPQQIDRWSKLLRQTQLAAAATAMATALTAQPDPTVPPDAAVPPTDTPAG